MSSSYQVRRDPSQQQQQQQQQQQSIYASTTTPSAATTSTTMYAPIAERAVPYEQYMARDADHVYSATRHVTPRNVAAATPSRAAVDGDVRQFGGSRETTVIDGSDAAPAGPRSDKARGGAGQAACITTGFEMCSFVC